MKKVILVCGSPRYDGNTMTVLKACADAIEKLGVQAEIIDIGAMDIQSCLACPVCQAEDFHCVRRDGANELFAQIAEADGLIVAAPVYFGTARGDMMNFLQRLGRTSRRSGDFLDGMIGGPIAVARRGGHTATIQEMLMFCFICGMIVPGSTYWNMVVAGEKDTAEQDEEGMATVLRFAGRVAELVKQLR